MASLQQAIAEELERLDSADLKIKRVPQAPQRHEIRLDSDIHQTEAAVLSVDIRQYSRITNAFGRREAVNILRKFFLGTVRICVENNGSVADFNGDGMIVVFGGEYRVDNAVRSCGQAKWFIDEMLRPQFLDALSGGQLVSDGEKLVDFDAGFAVDEGTMLVGPIGDGGHTDAVWVGDCVNTSAKLSKLASRPDSIMITRDAFDRLELDPGQPFHNGWKVAEDIIVGGVSQSVLTTQNALPLS